VGTFNIILKTIYNDEIEIDTDNVVELMGAAKHFGVEALRKACVNFMSEGVDREVHRRPTLTIVPLMKSN
jgi:hypothetical protein